MSWTFVKKALAADRLRLLASLAGFVVKKGDTYARLDEKWGLGRYGCVAMRPERHGTIRAGAWKYPCALEHASGA